MPGGGAGLVGAVEAGGGRGHGTPRQGPGDGGRRRTGPPLRSVPATVQLPCSPAVGTGEGGRGPPGTPERSIARGRRTARTGTLRAEARLGADQERMRLEDEPAAHQERHLASRRKDGGKGAGHGADRAGEARIAFHVGHGRVLWRSRDGASDHSCGGSPKVSKRVVGVNATEE